MITFDLGGEKAVVTVEQKDQLAAGVLEERVDRSCLACVGREGVGFPAQHFGAARSITCRYFGRPVSAPVVKDDDLVRAACLA